MKNLLNTLYVTTPEAYLRLEGETVCVEIEKKKILQVPLHHISSLVCFGETRMTPALMQHCTSAGKSIVYLDRKGDFAARIEGPISGNVLLRMDQFKAYNDADFVKDTARVIVGGKIYNSRQIILRGARESSSEADKEVLDRTAGLLGTLQEKLPNSNDLDQMRGIEGEAAKLYFQSLNRMIRADQRNCFEMKGRSRRPPLDRFNCILSFLYTLLAVDCRAALESVGLDPQIGFLHSVRPGRPALALDLLEEFRSVLADRVALSLVNRLQLQESDFETRPGGSVQFDYESRKTVISTYQKRKQEEITHPLLEEKVPLGVLPYVQARLLARYIRGDMDSYIPFMYR